MSGLSKDDAISLITEFAAFYKSANALAYYCRPTTKDLYGAKNSEGLLAGFKGGYTPGSLVHHGKALDGRIDVCLDNTQSKLDLLKTLRHEIIGHHGLNGFAPHEKNNILVALSKTQSNPRFATLWNKVNHHYSHLSLLGRAEEIFALRAEMVDEAALSKNFSAKIEGQFCYHEACHLKNRPMAFDDLAKIVEWVAKGMQDGSRKTHKAYLDQGRALTEETSSALKDQQMPASTNQKHAEKQHYSKSFGMR